MTETSARRRFQFDLRTLLLIVTIVAVWLAWRYAPPPKPESRIAKSLKVGDQVMIQESGGMYTVAIQGDPPRHNRHALWSRTRSWRPLTVEYVDDEVVRLRDSDQTEVLRIARIARIVRFDAAPKASTATAQSQPGANAGMVGGMGDESFGDSNSPFAIGQSRRRSSAAGNPGVAPRSGRSSQFGSEAPPNETGAGPSSRSPSNPPRPPR